jgi:hypothetical protein
METINTKKRIIKDIKSCVLFEGNWYVFQYEEGEHLFYKKDKGSLYIKFPLKGCEVDGGVLKPNYDGTAIKVGKIKKIKKEEGKVVNFLKLEKEESEDLVMVLDLYTDNLARESIIDNRNELTKLNLLRNKINSLFQ